LQRIESEGKAFIAFAGGVEVIFCRMEKIGDDDWSRKFHREQQRATAVQHQVFMQKVATSSPIPALKSTQTTFFVRPSRSGGVNEESMS
jgi:hypothetical protein